METMNLQKRKLRIDFQELINGYKYQPEDILLIYQWLIEIGKGCDKQYGWYRYGLHQSFYGYSCNNEKNKVVSLYCDWKDILYRGFVNLLCKTNEPKIVDNFLKENNITIGKIRIITICESISNREYFTNKAGQYRSRIADKLCYITTAYKGLELKKEYFHPDYEQRKHPRIIGNVCFGTDGKKWIVQFTFSFECFNYEPGWEYSIGQEEFECLPDFFDRVIETIDSLLVDSDNCDNCPNWIESEYHGDYLRNGYKGNCVQYEECKKPGVVKYKWWSEKERVCDNATYHSIVFPYYRMRK